LRTLYCRKVRTTLVADDQVDADLQICWQHVARVARPRTGDRLDRLRLWTLTKREWVIEPVLRLKLMSLRQGIDIASQRLWGRTVAGPSGRGLEIGPAGGGGMDRAFGPLLGFGHLKIHLLQPEITLARLAVVGLFRQSGAACGLFSQAVGNDQGRNLDY